MNKEDIDDIKTTLKEQRDSLEKLGKIPLPCPSLSIDEYKELTTIYNDILECNKVMMEIINGPVGGIEKLIERTK